MCVPACCYTPLHSCPSASSQGPPVRPQGPAACTPPVPLHSAQMPGSGLGKAAVFCVQWTAGTFQIRAECKVATKAASVGFFFLSLCLLMSFSIRPKWFGSTSIHTISKQHWQRITGTVSGSCSDLFRPVKPFQGFMCYIRH